MRVLPRPLEVPPTRARRLGGAEEKNARGGGTLGVWTRLFRGGGVAPLHRRFGGGGRKTISRLTCTKLPLVYINNQTGLPKR